MKNDEKQRSKKTEVIDIDPERRMIQALLKKPMHKRMNWLRKRLPNGGSCI